MKYEELVNEKETVISYEQIIEPRTKDSKLRITINKSENPTDLLIYPNPDSNVTTLQLDFPSFISYSVIYDDYTIENKDEVYYGQSFRIYQKSNLLESIPNLLGKNMKHFSLNCIEHKIDIISYDEPKITVVNNHNT